MSEAIDKGLIVAALRRAADDMEIQIYDDPKAMTFRLAERLLAASASYSPVEDRRLGALDFEVIGAVLHELDPSWVQTDGRMWAGLLRGIADRMDAAYGEGTE